MCIRDRLYPAEITLNGTIQNGEEYRDSFLNKQTFHERFYQALTKLINLPYLFYMHFLFKRYLQIATNRIYVYNVY